MTRTSVAKQQLRRLVSDDELRSVLGGVSKATLWRLRKKGIVPQPIKIASLNGTPEDVIKKLVDRLVAESCERESSGK